MILTKMEKIAKVPYLIAVFIMLTNASCKRNTGTECLRKAEVVMVNGESGYSSSELTDSISFLMLEEDANSSFTSVSKLRIADDRIILFDKMGRNALLAFDLNGNFITSYGKKGNAGNEYARLWDFDTDADYVYLYDWISKKMLYYDHSGKFVKMRKTTFRGEGFVPTEDGGFLFSLAKDDDNRKLCKVDSSLNIRECLLSYKEDESDDKVTDNLFQPAGGNIIYNKPVCDSIYIYSPSGECTECYRMDFDGENVPSAIRGSYERLLEEGGKKKYAFMYDCPMIANGVLLATVNHQGYKATLLYDLDEKRGSITDWKEGVRLSDIILPVYSCKDYIVGWMDYEVYSILADKERFSEEMVRHLKDGGRILVFYHLRNDSNGIGHGK